MNTVNSRKHLLAFSMMSSVLALGACSSDGGSDDKDPSGQNPADDPQTVELQGKVADGYISGATVCLDLNANKQCDAGEPSATTGAGGVYSLDATQAQIDASPLLVLIPNTAIDEDKPGEPVGKAYTMSAPAGSGGFVSPVTTMVQSKIESSNGTLDKVAAEAAVKHHRVETVESPLIEREQDTLQQLAAGHTVNAVAAKLGISVNTVKHYIKGIYAKTGATNRASMLKRAQEMGLIS